MPPKVAIILLNWNGLKDTLECLDSLSKIDYTNFDVIVVDNNSSGDDVKNIWKRYGEFISKLIINENNLGFSGGNNVGINYAIETGCDFVLLLNNDTVVEPDFLSILVKESNEISEVGMASPMMNYYHDKSKVWSAGGYISKWKASGFSKGYNKPDYLFNNIEFCSFSSGCCLLIKSDVIEKVGLLDENYFLYLEDADYCQRVNSAGFKILYVGRSKIYHKVHSTTAKSNALMPLYYNTRNRLYFAKKNLGFYFYIALIYIIFAFTIKLIFVFSQKLDTINTLLNAFADFFNNSMGQSQHFSKHG